MATIAITLTDERLAQLEALASRRGLNLEELARIGLEEWLDRPDESFRRLVDDRLEQSAELLRRLS